MSRSNTGKTTTGESRKLDLRLMLRGGWIKKNRKIHGQMSWTDGGEIRLETRYEDGEKHIRVVYTVTDREGKEDYYNYKILLDTVPSNLGKGEILYLVCPESGKRARVLYMTYGLHKFVHRDWYLERYGLRLYYETQIADKKYYHSTRFFRLEKQIKNLENHLFVKHRKTNYRGKPTKAFQKLQKLKELRDWHESIKDKIFIDTILNRF